MIAGRIACKGATRYTPGMERIIETNALPLNIKTSPGNPLTLFARWFAAAREADARNAHAVALATAASRQPSLRMVLLKQFDARGFVFYTNYESRKGRELSANPHAALLFWWPRSEQQVRIEGTVNKISRAASEAYFKARPLDSQLAAAASPQSAVIRSRDALETAVETLRRTFEDGSVPCPAGWGGLRLKPHRYEFWQGRAGRLHDRIEYIRSGRRWIRRLLAP